MQLFAKSGIDEDVLNQEAVINLLNFSVDGTITGYTGEDKSAKSTTYNIKIEADVNPFGLLKLINSTSKETILAACHKLGYFRLTIDETTKGYEGNVITIFFDTSVEDAIYINVNLNDLNISMASLASKAQLGGKYSFEYLYDTIAGLLGGYVAAESSNGVTDIIKDIITAISFDNNLTINLQSICDTLGALIAPLLEDVDLGDIESLIGFIGGKEGLVKGLLSALLNTSKGISIAGGNTRPSDMYAPVIEIAVNSATYGTCDKSYTVEDVADSHIVINTGDNTGYVKEITDGGILTDGSFKVVKGFENDLSAIMPNGGVVVLTGTDMNGATEQQFSGYVIGVDGVDGSIVGTPQDVTYNVIVGGNDLISLLAGFGMSPASLPLFGEPMKIEGKITLIDTVTEDMVESVSNFAKEIKVIKGVNIYENIAIDAAQPVTVVINGLTYTIDVAQPSKVVRDGSDEDIKDSMVGGAIKDVGKYVVTYAIGGYCIDVTVNVTDKLDLTLVCDKLAIGEYWNVEGYSNISYMLEGKKVTEKFDKTKVKVIDTYGVLGEKGADVTSDVLNSSKYSFTKPGVFTIQYTTISNGTLTDEITVGEFKATYIGDAKSSDNTITFGASDEIEAEDFKVEFAYKAVESGELVDKKDVVSEGVSLKFTAKSDDEMVSISGKDLGDESLFVAGSTEGSYKFDVKNLAIRNVTVSISVPEFVDSGTMSVEHDYKIIVDNGVYSSVTFKKPEMGKPVEFTFVKDKQTYSLKYDVVDSEWIIVDSEGTKQTGYTVKFTLGKGADAPSAEATASGKLIIPIGTAFSQYYSFSIADSNGYSYAIEDKTFSAMYDQLGGNEKGKMYFKTSYLIGNITYVYFEVDGKYVKGKSLAYENDKFVIIDTDGGKHVLEDASLTITSADGQTARDWSIDESGNITGWQQGDKLTFKATIKLADDYSFEFTSSMTAKEVPDAA